LLAEERRVLLHQDQRQVITQRIDPKLIMANTILQQNSLELVQHIEAELLENPALDVLEEDAPCSGDCLDPNSCPFCSQRNAQAFRESAAYETDRDNYSEAAYDPDDEYDPVGNLEAELTLQDHLRALLRAAVPEEDYPLGEYLIHCLDDNGWLDGEPEEIAGELRVDVSDVCRVLKVIQTFDPPGVAARDLQECMLIQLRFLREEGQGNALAEKMIRLHFEEVVSRKYGKLARATGVSVDKAKQAIEFVRSHLNPYPASQFRPPWHYKPTNNRSSVRPDVVIRRTEVGYEVEVQGGEALVLGVNPTYREAYNTIKNGNGNVPDHDRQHVTEYVERAELFIRNINQRRKTLRLITKCIIECQQGFLETGSRAYLRPLTRTKVAEMMGMHESTVSRATAKKYVQLPNQEVVPFEIFFNPSLSVKMAIEEIIAKEDPMKPLSDRQIVDLLKVKGIEVARRTVVKYRDSQKLLSSNRRRR
jgi:RNA polymerase sigma-54 factor